MSPVSVSALSSLKTRVEMLINQSTKEIQWKTLISAHLKEKSKEVDVSKGMDDN